MYKLLTPEERAKAEAEYRSRRARAILMLTIMFLCFTIISLSPALILALGRKNAALVALSTAPDASASEEYQMLTEWAESERRTLVALAQGSTTAPYTYFTKMLRHKPTGARVTSLSYTKTSNSMNVRGRAIDRAALLAFQSALVSSGDFTKVDFPVDNLAKDKDIDFQFTLMPKI